MSSKSSVRKKLEDRWETDPIYIDVKAKLVEANNDQYNASLEPLVDERLRNKEGLIDLRGFNFNWAASIFPLEPIYRGGVFSNLDFSYSKCATCNIFGSRFVSCNFSNGDFRDMGFGSDTLECNFDDTTIMGTQIGINSKHEKSSFIRLKVRGNGFDFGMFTTYRQCMFKDVTLTRLEWSDSTVFEHCFFSGTFSESDFTDKKSLQKRRWSDLMSLFERRRFPSRFLHCDLKGLVCGQVEFNDVEFIDCNLSDSIIQATRKD